MKVPQMPRIWMCIVRVEPDSLRSERYFSPSESIMLASRPTKSTCSAYTSSALYTSTPDYVRTADELTRALEKLANSDFLAIDTEFLRERTYYPKFCLLQIGTAASCVLIDVQELPSLAPVLDFLNDRSRTKVLHAAHQDLEVLALANGKKLGATLAPLAGPFFDTQVAAAFLGMPGNIGYADLVQRRLQLNLDK